MITIKYCTLLWISFLFLGQRANAQSAQLYVEESGQHQVGIWTENKSISNTSRWGIFSSADGTGSGIRYGVVGQGQNSTGTKYGIYGQTTGSGTNYAVYANGDLAYSGSISDVSDMKFKKNITDFTALDRVMQLCPKTYEMKQDEFKRMNLASGQRYGFIAQDMREVFPEMVREQVNAVPYKDDGDSLAIEEIQYLGVDYISLVPVLTQAIHEQQEIIESQDQRISQLDRQVLALQHENGTLEGRLNQLEVILQELNHKHMVTFSPPKEALKH